MPRTLLITTLLAAALTAHGQANSAGEVQPLLEQARQQIAAGDTNAAIDSLRRALAISPNSPPANLTLGDLFAQQHRFPEAMDRFETVLAIDRRSPQARQGELNAATELALQAKRSGDQQAALVCLRHARESLPDDPVLLRDLGIQLFDMHYLRPAAEALTQSITLDPSDAASLYSLARVETELQQFPPAEKHFVAYLKLLPDDATAHYGLGHMLQMQQRIVEAKSEFQRSIDLQPQQTESYFQLGQIALDQGNAAEAKPLFERALSRAPAHGGALTGLGILAFQSKDYPTASDWLQRATIASPEYQPAHYYLGLTLARLHDKEGSARELKAAVDLATIQQGKAAPLPPEAPP